MNNFALLVRKVSSRGSNKSYGSECDDLRRLARQSCGQGKDNCMSSLEYLCQNSKFTRNEIKLMYRTFKQAFHGGILTEQNLIECLGYCFPGGGCEKYAELLYPCIDVDCNGQVSFTDVVMCLSVLSRGSYEEKLSWIFQLYDTDQDGLISRDDMRTFLRAVYAIMDPSTASTSVNDLSSIDSLIDRRLNQIFEKLDLKKDDVIDKREFMDACIKDEVIRCGIETELCAASAKK